VTTGAHRSTPLTGDILKPLRFDAIVLAAGAGTRFGGGKLLAPWRRGLLIEAALEAACSAPVRSVILVTGADAGVMPVALEWAMTEGETERLRTVHAPDHAEGMGASLRAGVAALPTDCGGVFVFLGDMPRIPHAILPRLAAAMASGAAAAAAVHGGRRGHPALLGAALFPALLGLKGDEGARTVLKGLGDRLALVPTNNDGVLFDVDTPEQL
jgi:molybdenum cofactor cytidylyltransferase